MSRSVKSLLLDIRDGIRARPAAVGLAFFAIAIGVSALAVLVAVLDGLQEKSRHLVQELGADVAAVFQARDGAGTQPRLSDRHAAVLRKNLPNSAVTTVRVYAAPALGTTDLVSVVATDEHFLRVRQWRLVAGRFFDERDLVHRERVAVVAEPFSKRWGWSVGSVVLVHSLTFKVVGVVAVGSAVADAGADDPRLMLGERVVLVPKSVAPVWSNEYDDPADAADAIFVRASTGSALADVVSTSQRLFNHPDLRTGALSWLTPEMLIERIRGLRATVTWTAGTIAILCLMLGGTTLMALMVSSVRERTVEIGLRRALGASPTDVAALFVVEGCVITSIAAAVAGVCVAVILGFTKEKSPLPIHLSAAAVLLPLLAALGLGIVFSYWPAMSAARISPSEALRDA